jgi:hypothetical protein
MVQSAWGASRIPLVRGVGFYLIPTNSWSKDWGPPQDSIAIAFSLVALAVSLVSSFKNELFDFSLDVVAGELVLAAPTGPSHNSLALVFPLSFLNLGYGEGVIEGLAVKAVFCKTGQAKLYTPVAEIDIEKFIQGRRRLHAENALGAFAPFPLHSKEVVKKHILFTQEEHNEKHPFSPWEAGTYRLEIYAKTSASKQAERVSVFEKEITQEMLDSYFSGNSQYLMAELIGEV